MSTSPFYQPPPPHPLLANSPALAAGYAMIESQLGGPANAALVLHGSTTIGFDDPHADLDLWVLSDDDAVQRFDQAAGTRFIEFNSPRKGHFQIESIEAFRQRMACCEFELISELRHAQLIQDFDSQGAALLAEARKPMSDEVRFAWFCYHYVEMRGEHRACDNSVERSNAAALLMCVTRTIQNALQAAMILDREPYRYSKWLLRMAERGGTTGKQIVPMVNDAVWLISAGALLDPGPEREHRLSRKLREIRQALIDSAHAEGIDEPWLTEWYLHIDKARRGVHDVRW